MIIGYYYIIQGDNNKVPKLREPPAIQAVEEIVGRATEMGRPITFTTGYTGMLYASMALDNLAGVAVLGEMAKMAATKGAHIIGTFAAPEMQLVAYGTVKDAHVAAGMGELEPDMRFLSSMEFSHAAAHMGIMRREKVAGNVMLGAIAGENVLWGATAAELGAMQLGGMAIGQVAFFVALCDYVLIGEELYAAGAILSNDPSLISALSAEDIPKLMVILIIVIGSILATVNSAGWLINLLGL
jgi:hypothetical protein